MANNDVIENERLAKLNETRKGEELENQQQRQESAKQPLIGTGEAIMLLAFTGVVEIMEWAFDLIPILGWIINLIITIFVGVVLTLWVSGKVLKGASKKWYKTIYLGAVGSAIPIIPGYIGAIIYLLIQDRKIFGKK